MTELPALDLLEQAGDPGGQRLSHGVEVVEDQRAHRLDLDRRQAELLGLESLQRLGAPGAAQLSGQMIGPGVIGAGDDPGAPGAGQELMGAMGADIVEAAQAPVLAAADEDALVVDGGGDVAARLRQVAHMAGEMPAPEEDRLALPGEDLGRGVEMRGQGQRARGIAIERPVLEQGFPSRHGVLLDSAEF